MKKIILILTLCALFISNSNLYSQTESFGSSPGTSQDTSIRFDFSRLWKSPFKFNTSIMGGGLQTDLVTTIDPTTGKLRTQSYSSFTAGLSSGGTTYTAGAGLTLNSGAFALDGAYADGRYLKIGGNSPSSLLTVGNLTNQDFTIVQGTSNNTLLYAFSSSTGGTDNVISNTNRGWSIYAGQTTANYGWAPLNISNEEGALGVSLSRKSTDLITWSSPFDSNLYGMYGGSINGANNARNLFVIGEDGRLAFKAGRGNTNTLIYKDSASLDITRTRFRVRNIDPSSVPMLQSSTSLTAKRLELYSVVNTTNNQANDDNEGNVTVTVNLPSPSVDQEYTVHITTVSGTLGGLIFNPSSGRTIISNATWTPGVNQPEGVIRLYYFADSQNTGRWQILN